MNTLQAEWESYLKVAIPEDAHEIQLIETRRAFYAGAKAFFSLQLNMPDGITEAVEEAILTGWSGELKQFYQDLESGKA